MGELRGLNQNAGRQAEEGGSWEMVIIKGLCIYRSISHCTLLSHKQSICEACTCTMKETLCYESDNML